MTFGDDFSIRNESGKDVYYVDGRAFTFGADLSVYNMDREEEARIKQKLFTIRPTFYIYCDNEHVATVSKALFTIRPQFVVETVAGEKIRVIGNFIFYDYVFYRGSLAVAEVSKRIISITDSYGVQIAEGEDDLLILCAAIVVDMSLHGKNRKKKK